MKQIHILAYVCSIPMLRHWSPYLHPGVRQTHPQSHRHSCSFYFQAYHRASSRPKHLLCTNRWIPKCGKKELAKQALFLLSNSPVRHK